VETKVKTYSWLILSALEAKYRADAQACRANIQVYMESSSGIGEHSDIVSSVDEQVAKLAEAEDKLAAIQSLNRTTLPK